MRERWGRRSAGPLGGEMLPLAEQCIHSRWAPPKAFAIQNSPAKTEEPWRGPTRRWRLVQSAADMGPCRISRRTVLRGAGGIAVGLPLLEEMAASTSDSAVPVRAFNVFFGLGVPAPFQEEGFEGVMEPLEPLASKLLILRGVDQVRCDEAGINAHFDGSSGAFTAEPPNGEALAGGPSIDQVVRRTHYPDGQPSGVAPTVVAGTYFRRSRVSRYVHSYNHDGTVAAAMQEKPRALFDRVFGKVVLSDEPTDARQGRLRRSVLDSVVGQYQYFTGINSPLGAKSRARLADHLDRIREFELRAFSERPGDTGGPQLPPRSRIAHGGYADPGGEGIDMDLGALTDEWRIVCDLYALAVELDRVRFGSLTFLAAGERLRITGDYRYAGRRIFEFDDAGQRNASGAKGCSHEWWHDFDPRERNEQLRAHAHMHLREVAYFLERLDEVRDANGKSALENSMVTVSTESGDGRHSDVKRELSGVFHAISGANARFKTGAILDLGVEGIDLYNTMLEAMGTSERLGPADREMVRVDAIRA